MTTDRQLDGKVALVTGGSRGIGAAIARRLAGMGAAVALTYGKDAEGARAVAEGISAAGGRALAIAADNADAVAVRQAVAATVDRFGQVDILVNNAGLLIRGLVDDYPLADFDRMFAVNVRAPFVAIQAALPHMGQGGRVINISSNTAHRSFGPGSSVYTLTKTALDGLTWGLARELAAKGITINAINPGPTRTVMGLGATDDGELGQKLRSMIPVGRVAEPEEIAGMVAHLVGPESGYINGARLVMDGGMSV